MNTIDNTYLSALFPQEKTEEFFQNQYFGTTSEMFDIVLVCSSETKYAVELVFELRQRPGRSRMRSYGLGRIFACNPDINAAGIAKNIATKKGWKRFTWKIGSTQEISSSIHGIPFLITGTQCGA